LGDLGLLSKFLSIHHPPSSKESDLIFWRPVGALLKLSQCPDHAAMIRQA
jgi:hypothetical protein